MEEFKSSLKSWLFAILITALIVGVIAGLSLIFLYAPLWVKIIIGVFFFSGTIYVGNVIANCCNDDNLY